MQFIHTGFIHEKGFRVFAFERLGENRVRTKCTVRADLALVRTYGIHIQELPLLCRDLLGRHDQGEQLLSLTFTEEEMRGCANERAAARALAASKRKHNQRSAAGDNVAHAGTGLPTDGSELAR